MFAIMKMLFLDDWRIPRDCAQYMWQRKVNCTIFHQEWDIVRSHGQFINWIETNCVPDLVSFDYDLADVEELKEELPIEEWFSLDENRVWTGLDCAKYLLNYCKENNIKFPDYIIHSVNPDGVEKIKKLLSI
jgi:hypothetical protein